MRLIIIDTVMLSRDMRERPGLFSTAANIFITPANCKLETLNIQLRINMQRCNLVAQKPYFPGINEH